MRKSISIVLGLLHVLVFAGVVGYLRNVLTVSHMPMPDLATAYAFKAGWHAAIAVCLGVVSAGFTIAGMIVSGWMLYKRTK